MFFCCTALTLATKAAAAYALGFGGDAYTQAALFITIQYLASGMMVSRKPYHSPLLKWLIFSVVEAPPNLFLRVMIDLGVMMPVIFVMMSFCTTSMSYVPFFDDLMTLWLHLCLWRW
jgi:hypothetical protein